MRLLKGEDDGSISLTEWTPSEAPRYAILSHTWGKRDEEVTFRDIFHGSATRKTGYRKIDFCRKQAASDGLQYFWVDTCCIDKSNNNELSRAINSMFRWYRDATHCYVYLSDVSNGTAEPSKPWDAQFQQSRWFTRGWTLQELLAPASVRFFSVEGGFLGDKMKLAHEIHTITNIKLPALQGSSLSQFSIAERMNWSHSRQTTEEEDVAYCLLGIFDVFIPLIYGEGKGNAMSRLLEAIEKRTGAPHSSPLQHRQLNSQTQLPFDHSDLEDSRNSHFIVPFGQNEDFVGRNSILAELLGKILPKAKRNDCQRTAVEGLGGVGKTQIALEAAYRARDQESNCSVFWVPAMTQVTFENAYRKIGHALGTPRIDDEKADVKELVKAALEKSTIYWLLIIDNIDDISLLAARGLQDFLPFSRHGSILFTTRNHEVTVRLGISAKNVYELQQMSEDEALKMLHSGLKERQFRDTQATKLLLEHLTYLPLAIKQASAYMARTGETAASYLQYCLQSDDTHMELLNADFEDRWRYSNNTNPITTTWLISFQHLAKSYPLAGDYLKFACFLAEKDIPVSLLPPGQDEREENEAIGILEGYAFITIREQTDSFDIHRLVRLATRNWIKTEWETRGTEVLRHVSKVFPVPMHENRHIWMRYMPHAEMVLQLQGQCTEKAAIAHLLYVVAMSFDRLGKYMDAEQLHRKAFKLRDLVFGRDHPSTLNSITGLGNISYNQGKYLEAEQLHRQAIDLGESLLGWEDPKTLGSIYNLGITLGRQGQYMEAEQLQRYLLDLRKSVLGPNHPDTLDSKSCLAVTLNQQGQHIKAEQLLRNVLDLRRSVLGPNHPDTLVGLNNLAVILGDQENYVDAERMHRQALELRGKLLGPNHPQTLISLNNLAVTLERQENYVDAEHMHRQALEQMESVLGPNHPSTIVCRNNLQDCLHAMENDDWEGTPNDSDDSDEGGVFLH